jgi:hypothetical protein
VSACGVVVINCVRITGEPVEQPPALLTRASTPTRTSAVDAAHALTPGGGGGDLCPYPAAAAARSHNSRRATRQSSSDLAARSGGVWR